MSELKSLVGKTVAEVSEGDVLNEGVRLTFTDGTVLECSWYAFEGYFKIETL